MTLETAKQIGLYGGGAVLLLMTLIQITPIKLNPWSAIGKWIGRVINAEVIEKVDNIASDVKLNEQEWAELRRTHILRFGDEIRLGVSHSEEHFNQVLLDIHKYNTYCQSHKDYKNDKAITTIELIEKTYSRCLSENDFL